MCARIHSPNESKGAQLSNYERAQKTAIAAALIAEPCVRGRIKQGYTCRDFLPA